MRVVIVGGGYAGLACALDLRKLAPRAELHLIDPGDAHVKQTRLHEALHRPLEDLRVPFSQLAVRCGFEHHREALGRDGVFDVGVLRAWHDEGTVPVGARRLGYDYLVIATGARPRLRADTSPGVVDQLILREREGRTFVDACLGADRDTPCATVVGGGASGVQYAFELAEVLRRRAPGTSIRLIDSTNRLLSALPVSTHDYVAAQMQAAGIEYLSCTAYLGPAASSVRVRDADGRERELPSALTLLFGGVEAHPFELHANRFGQIVADGRPLERIFAAGDCARYATRGLDAMTAQAAVRKGKHVAANISRLHRGRMPVSYEFQELGYIVSMGSVDSIGWLLVRENVVRGAAATVLRQIVEAQYDLFVDGLDTYIV
jgi:NADH dehydrogenase